MTTGHNFMIDTGAEVSVLPPQDKNDNVACGPSLTAANGTKIQTWGRKTVYIKLGCKTFKWSFVVAAVDRPIIGSDLLRESGLLVDIKGQRLVDADTLTTAVPLVTVSNYKSLCLESFAEAKDSYGHLLSQFPAITTPTFAMTQVKHGVEHTIQTEGPLPKARARRLEPGRLVMAKAAFQDLMNLGIAYRSDSCCSSALVVVDKPDGSVRCCGDYGPLNAITVPDKYPIPHIQDFTAHLYNCKIFSKVDLVKGYHQIPMKKQDKHKTAIITPFGLYEYNRMPFGLKNAAQTFQRLMDTVTQGLDFIFVYLDDILVASCNKAQHLDHLKQLFQRLADHGLVINPKKCEFGKSKINFLGHEVTPEGIKPDTKKVDVLRNFQRPITVKGLQEFVGMVNFYHRFIPNVATFLKPMYELLKGKPGPKSVITWTQLSEQSFEKAKHCLADAALLAHPKPNAIISVTTDASDVAVGAVAQQWENDKGWCPLGFFSRKLREPELKYSAYDKELLAIKLALRHFRYLVEGRVFTVYTDHKPLTFALSKKKSFGNMRQQRTLAEISEYTTDIRHIAGKQNPVADALSRAVICSIRQTIDYVLLSDDQKTDEELKKMQNKLGELQWVNIPIDEAQSKRIVCDMSTGNPRPYLPDSWRRKAFESIHNLSHPSIRTTVKLLAAKFIWFGLKAQVRKWARDCLKCQKAKVQVHTKAPLVKFELPGTKFAHIHVDVVGPLPTSQGYSYLLTVIDRFTRWPDVFPMANMDSETCAKALVGWISRYGVPTQITSDRGRQFTGKLWSALCYLYGAKIHHSNAYHPQSNGIIERFHRHLKTSLKAVLIENGESWMNSLPWIMLGIRTAPKEDFQACSAELVYGCPLTVPGDFIPSQTRSVNEYLVKMRKIAGNLAPVPTNYHGHTTTYVPQDLTKAEYVFIRQDGITGPLKPPYMGPFKVIKRSSKTFVVDYGGRPEAISIDRLKKAHVDPTRPVKTEVPPKRGRPPM